METTEQENTQQENTQQEEVVQLVLSQDAKDRIAEAERQYQEMIERKNI